MATPATPWPGSGRVGHPWPGSGWRRHPSPPHGWSARTSEQQWRNDFFLLLLFFSQSSKGELGGGWAGPGDQIWAVGVTCAWRSQVAAWACRTRLGWWHHCLRGRNFLHVQQRKENGEKSKEEMRR
ncbi:hypothetical protein FH972_022284 [Carpinus fangiana]|uniref:Uncharacterized protein n=1 Tax=Carpinus fangiana TaxID=176857 RepID=A0A5N6KU10_9ROSI|nr:hypothetical protein FH972_022284 [Carpinus fangiana]